jgi:hypothetical protein
MHFLVVDLLEVCFLLNLHYHGEGPKPPPPDPPVAPDLEYLDLGEPPPLHPPPPPDDIIHPKY